MTSPRELLAAYAAGGLSEEEQARVEALLAEDADARAELEQLRALIDETREARPMPSTEPSWDDMARSIRLAVDQAPASWWSRWWLRPIGIAGVAALGAVALYFATYSGSDTGAGGPEHVVESEQPIEVDIELPGLDEAWDGDSITYDLEPTEEFEDMFAATDGDDDDEVPMLDFRRAPDFDELLDTYDEES